MINVIVNDRIIELDDHHPTMKYELRDLLSLFVFKCKEIIDNTGQGELLAFNLRGIKVYKFIYLGQDEHSLEVTQSIMRLINLVYKHLQNDIKTEAKNV